MLLMHLHMGLHASNDGRSHEVARLITLLHLGVATIQHQRGALVYRRLNQRLHLLLVLG